MKKLEFETIKSRFLVVDIPINFLFKIHHNHLVVDSTSNGLIGKMNRLNDDLKGFIEVGRLIAKLSEMTEEEANGIVDSTRKNIREKDIVFQDYQSKYKKDFSYDTAIESLHSLLKSKGVYLFRNPYTSKINPLEYKEAKEKTFYNPYIFKI